MREMSLPWRSDTVVGDLQLIQLEKIKYKDRVQPPDPELLKELTKSIEKDGLQVPIVVKVTNDYTYVLISGYHRLMAYHRLLDKHGTSSKIHYNKIPAIVMSRAMTADEMGLCERVENVTRRNLPPKEKARLASEIQELRAKIWGIGATGANSENTASGAKKSKRGRKADPWFKDWYTGGGIPQKTAENTWKRFKLATAQRDVTPGSAEGAALQAQFRAWTAAEDDRRIEAQQAQQRADEQAQAAAARTKRRDTMIQAVGAVFDADGDGEVFDVLREMRPDLTITVLPNPSS